MLTSLRGILTGLGINLQFFTTIPIKRELPMSRFHLSFALRTFPLLGLLQGVIYASVLFVFLSYTPFSEVIIALCLWLVMILLSGGIHLDGLIDTSDAYFSYREPEKRLEVMQDPRVGAFGVLSVVVFLGVRFVILYKLVTMAHDGTYLLVVLIPFLGKMLMGAYLQVLPAARNNGMAHFFKQGASRSFWVVYGFYLITIGSLIGLLNSELLASYFILVSFMIVIGYIIASKIKKHFGGISGDTLGASSEGMELVLWIVMWLLHSFAMV
ncbi:adenosylcobinamide-GDP ribazoletransferase [Lentibacillus amyloliquefaciens]|uniref:Adenosylcobinamide-GDP ribazoletransferase n=1 Tax=Lentibacillus amyloliquefaciens TaxID=1472767 RepID=A0A0U4FDJ0_9BACI|nr:adenosylcobinamide-GDP ribazoletransferase [Lentibacillus amyloliquefaciens]ALX48557.1 cobalamin synthase [Lentibacillus amyloliquefaciens]